MNLGKVVRKNVMLTSVLSQRIGELEMRSGLNGSDIIRQALTLYFSLEPNSMGKPTLDYLVPSASSDIPAEKKGRASSRAKVVL